MLIDLLFFLGKDASRPVTGNGITHDTVMQMVENFQDKGHHLYMDNFYTSPTPFSSLWDVGIGACGTVRCNRIGVPTSIKNPPTKLKKGDIISEKKENLMFLKWKDKREVTLLTT